MTYGTTYSFISKTIALVGLALAMGLPLAAQASEGSAAIPPKVYHVTQSSGSSSHSGSYGGYQGGRYTGGSYGGSYGGRYQGGGYGGGYKERYAPRYSGGNYHYSVGYRSGRSGFGFGYYPSGRDSDNGYSGAYTSIQTPHRADWYAKLQAQRRWDEDQYKKMQGKRGPECGFNGAPAYCYKLMGPYPTEYKVVRY